MLDVESVPPSDAASFADRRIRQLPSLVVTKIAAGEVIERPASVVKELLENAVDAGSTRIDIEIEQGGTELIRVVDNGCGIVPEDLPLAFSSHATSKLNDADDLFRIGTLGFRGEALASIGGVAQVSLQSRTHADHQAGAELTCHGGDLSPVRTWNGSPGTRIEVRHLFFNTPVRRKFLRSPPTELGHITEIFTRLALSHPGTHLTLRHNGRKVHEVPAQAALLDRIGLFFGPEVRDRLYEVERDAGPITLRGCIADPACERGNAKLQYLFVNGRWIRDRSLSHALQEAYRGLLMTGRYAVAFLFLDLPPDAIDVNVHPTKVEVRFQNGPALYGLLLGTVRDRLRRENLTGRLQPSSLMPTRQSNGAGESSSWSLSAPPRPAPSLPFAPPPPRNIASTFVEETEERDRAAENDVVEVSDAEEAEGVETVDSTEHTPVSPPGAGATIASEATLPILQIYDCYLVMETPEGMLVVDQHALHERILFEQLKSRMRNGPLEKQRLLIPEPVDMPAQQTAAVMEHQEALAEIGLELEEFSGGTLMLTAYPALLGQRSPQAIARSVIDHLIGKERIPNREQLLNDLLSLMACRAAVKAGDRLTAEQMAALLEQRHLVNDTHHCPHGRPTSLLFTRHDLERQFGRV